MHVLQDSGNTQPVTLRWPGWAPVTPLAVLCSTSGLPRGKIPAQLRDISFSLRMLLLYPSSFIYFLKARLIQCVVNGPVNHPTYPKFVKILAERTSLRCLAWPGD